MANPFPFSSGSVLTASELNSIGEWTSYTPTWQGFTPGNSTLSFSYAQVNDVVHVRFNVLLGSTGSFTGSTLFTFPVASTGYTSYHSMGVIACYDTGGSVYLGHAAYWPTDRCYIRVGVASGSYLTSSAINATVRFTWTTGDLFFGQFSYRAA